MQGKRANSSLFGKNTNYVHILMLVFLGMCVINVIYLKRTSVMLLEIENAILLAKNRGKLRDANTIYAESSSDRRNLSNANSIPNYNSDTMKPVESRVEPSNRFSSNSFSVSSVVPAQRPPTPERQIADPGIQGNRHWAMKTWKFELSSTNTIVLEQISPEDAVPYGRHYTESMKNRSRPLRPGTAAVSDAASLAALSPADFASIKRIWIWGRPLAARSMLRAFPWPPSSTAACPELIRASAFALAPPPGGDEKRTAHPRPRSRPRAPPVFVCLRHSTMRPRPAAGRRPTGPRR